MDEKDQGFTLIELLVVMIIIGILAAIAIPVFMNQRRKATESSMKSDLRTVANQMETYFTDHQVYAAPTQAARVVTIGTETVTISTGNTLTAVGLTTANAAIAAAAGVYPASAGFCLTVANTSAGQSWYYNSVNGGLSTTACPA
jgi:prepilin-type N-terminal cleavage/methylation domain-containing protein